MIEMGDTLLRNEKLNTVHPFRQSELADTEVKESKTKEYSIHYMCYTNGNSTFDRYVNLRFSEYFWK
jgi:hypothetical protein